MCILENVTGHRCQLRALLPHVTLRTPHLMLPFSEADLRLQVRVDPLALMVTRLSRMSINANQSAAVQVVSSDALGL